MNMTDTQSLYDNYLVILNQHYQLLSEGRTDAVGVLTDSTVLQIESKIDELRQQLHNLNH